MMLQYFYVVIFVLLLLLLLSVALHRVDCAMCGGSDLGSRLVSDL